MIDLQTAHFGEVIALRIEEQIFEEVARRFGSGRIAGPETLIDLIDRLFGGLHFIGGERVSDIGADI
jgi:hypothetical protein